MASATIATSFDVNVSVGSPWAWGWPAVEALATVVAACGAVVALLYAKRAAKAARDTWTSSTEQVSAMQEQLSLHAEELRLDAGRWQEEQAERLRVRRREAAQLKVLSNVHVGGDSGLELDVVNESPSMPFIGVTVDADPRMTHVERARLFAYSVGNLDPGQRHHLEVPSGVFWRVRYYDIGFDRWELNVFSDGVPTRIVPPELDVEGHEATE
ncbi:MAG: hypothetical protein AAGF73_08945 [Actinomycetota bacterium]